MNLKYIYVFISKSESILGGEDEEEGGVDLDENIEMRVGEEGGDLTDGQQHHGGEEGRHHAAGQGPGMTKEESNIFSFPIFPDLPSVISTLITFWPGMNWSQNLISLKKYWRSSVAPEYWTVSALRITSDLETL